MLQLSCEDVDYKFYQCQSRVLATNTSATEANGCTYNLNSRQQPLIATKITSGEKRMRM